MSIHIFHTVNAGLYIYNREQGILIDGLHLGGGGFSETPAAFLARLFAQEEISAGNLALAFTHLHEDHYNPALVRRFLGRYPASGIYLPNPEPQTEQVYFGDFLLTAFPTVHDGASFKDLPHRSFCLQAEGKQLVICGDGIVDAALAFRMQSLCARKTDAVFVNVYQLASSDGCAFLNTLNPDRIFLYHLPFPEDDSCHYREMARRIVLQQSRVLSRPISVPDPMTHIPV